MKMKTDASSKERSHSDTNRPTIGIILGKLTEQYDSFLWSGMINRIRQNDANSITYNTNPVFEKWSDNSFQVICYDLVETDKLDALAIQTAALVTWTEVDDIIKATTYFSDKLPICNIGMSINEQQATLVDNYGAMYSLVEHLLADHNYRRIAFVTGHHDNTEAMERFRAYRDALENHGIDYNENLVSYGDFHIFGAKEAVSQFYDGDDELGIEAIVASNDTMAKIIISELNKRGYSVPQDVAVTGFDDLIDSKYFLPPLTTVHQPMRKLGEMTIDRILATCSGEQKSETISLPTELVVRASCGCDYNPELLQPKQENDNWILRHADSTALHNRRAVRSRLVWGCLL